MIHKPILVLGGGRHQIDLIRYIKSCGYPVVLSDYLCDSPGHKIATVSSLTSTLDVEANIDLARTYEVCGLITSGTDQPLVTMAKVSSHLGLNCYLSPETARVSTNKVDMFRALGKAGIDIPAYHLVRSKVEVDAILADTQFPVIVKPAASQGQRGITVAHNREDLLTSIDNATGISTEHPVILQRFIEGPEMTISAWAREGKAQILLITDRVTYNKTPATGVCLQHIYPSKHIEGMESQARDLTQQIVTTFGLSDGPIYIQFIRHHNKLHLVEATCRVGGGHEEHLIQVVTGINIRQHLLSLAISGKSDTFPELSSYPLANKYALVNFIVARPGVLARMEKPTSQEALVAGGFYYSQGYEQLPIVNSMGRVGYLVCTGLSRDDSLRNAENLYRQFRAYSQDGENLVFWPSPEHLNQ